jgi:hypothetical protein
MLIQRENGGQGHRLRRRPAGPAAPLRGRAAGPEVNTSAVVFNAQVSVRPTMEAQTDRVRFALVNDRRHANGKGIHCPQ